jgi:hypothetical protein
MKNDMKVLLYLAVSSSAISICKGDRQVADNEKKIFN